MQDLLDQLAKTRRQIEKNASEIVRLQERIKRLQRDGEDPGKARKMLADLHAVHLQVLATQAHLQKALAKVEK